MTFGPQSESEPWAADILSAAENLTAQLRHPGSRKGSQKVHLAVQVYEISFKCTY